MILATLALAGLGLGVIGGLMSTDRRRQQENAQFKQERSRLETNHMNALSLLTADYNAFNASWDASVASKTGETERTIVELGARATTIDTQAQDRFSLTMGDVFNRQHQRESEFKNLRMQQAMGLSTAAASAGSSGLRDTGSIRAAQDQLATQQIEQATTARQAIDTERRSVIDAATLTRTEAYDQSAAVRRQAVDTQASFNSWLNEMNVSKANSANKYNASVSAENATYNLESGFLTNQYSRWKRGKLWDFLGGAFSGGARGLDIASMFSQGG